MPPKGWRKSDHGKPGAYKRVDGPKSPSASEKMDLESLRRMFRENIQLHDEVVKGVRDEFPKGYRSADVTQMIITGAKMLYGKDAEEFLDARSDIRIGVDGLKDFAEVDDTIFEGIERRLDAMKDLMLMAIEGTADALKDEATNRIDIANPEGADGLDPGADGEVPPDALDHREGQDPPQTGA